MKRFESQLPAFTRELLSYGLSDALPTIATRDNIFAMQFNVMKMLPAAQTIIAARRSGKLKAGQPVAETSSGSYAIGAARICQVLGHPLTIVSADLETWLRDALIHLGATVELVNTNGDITIVQRQRLAKLNELRRQNDAFWTCQYHNPENPNGYVAAAELLVRQIGVPDILVAPVGSGGNSRGLIVPLRAINPAIQLVGVDCFGSVTFGQPVAARELGGIGNSLMPRCVAHNLFTRVDWVGAAVASTGVRVIAEDGLGDFGLTSGAAYMVAKAIHACQPDARIAVVFPDRGFRYADFMAKAEVHDAKSFRPIKVCHPVEAKGSWAYIDWNRRTLREVLR